MEGIRKAAPAERLIGVTARAGFGNFILKGVKYTDIGQIPATGEACITLPIKPLEVDWAAMRGMLIAGGIDEDRAFDYVEKMACKIECEEMAAFIADHLQRIG
jgi:hypothetical protein